MLTVESSTGSISRETIESMVDSTKSTWSPARTFHSATEVLSMMLAEERLYPPIHVHAVACTLSC
jgi:hypothetical protein